jgi:hypothetical protein
MTVKVTTSAGKLFQTSTILSEKKNTNMRFNYRALDRVTSIVCYYNELQMQTRLINLS